MFGLDTSLFEEFITLFELIECLDLLSAVLTVIDLFRRIHASDLHCLVYFILNRVVLFIATTQFDFVHVLCGGDGGRWVVRREEYVLCGGVLD